MLSRTDFLNDQIVSPANADFLDKLRRRDAKTVQAVVEDNSRRLFRAARAWGLSPDEAEDAVQEVFVTFFETLNRFEGRSRVSTWLFGILHHKTLERRRARAVEQRHDPIDEVFEARFDSTGRWKQPPADVERLYASQEVRGAVDACLETVPPQQREVFVLRIMEELSGAEVCKILGHTVTHVGVLLHRARTRLRDCLEAKGMAIRT